MEGVQRKNLTEVRLLLHRILGTLPNFLRKSNNLSHSSKNVVEKAVHVKVVVFSHGVDSVTGRYSGCPAEHSSYPSLLICGSLDLAAEVRRSICYHCSMYSCCVWNYRFLIVRCGSRVLTTKSIAKTQTCNLSSSHLRPEKKPWNFIALLGAIWQF